MEENVFYVSPWHTWNCERSELVLTFSQTFCLKTNARSHSLLPLLSGQILLTSLFPEECNCILFPPCSCRVPAACQCKQLPSLPRRRARRRGAGWAAGSVSLPCDGVALAAVSAANQDIWCCVFRRWALCFPPPVASVLGELGAAWAGARWLCVCGLHLSRDRLVVSACCPLCHPAPRSGG